MRTASVVVVCALAAAACKGEKQTAKEAMQLLCNAYQDSEAARANPAERQQTIARWIERKITNAEVRALLADRVEVRCAFGQDIDEEATFAAAYVAQMFIPDAAVDAVWRSTIRALAPGGWLTTGAMALDGAELGPSIGRFRCAIWGGGVRSPQDVVAALERAGFVEIRTMPAPGMVAILARRAST